jgi:hypothetical protein
VLLPFGRYVSFDCKRIHRRILLTWRHIRHNHIYLYKICVYFTLMGCRMKAIQTPGRVASVYILHLLNLTFSLRFVQVCWWKSIYISWRITSSWMFRRVALVRTDASKERSAYCIRVTRIGELGTTLAVTSNRLRQRRNTWYFLQEPFFIVTAVKTSNLTLYISCLVKQ